MQEILHFSPEFSIVEKLAAYEFLRHEYLVCMEYICKIDSANRISVCSHQYNHTEISDNFFDLNFKNLYLLRFN